MKKTSTKHRLTNALLSALLAASLVLSGTGFTSRAAEASAIRSNAIESETADQVTPIPDTEEALSKATLLPDTEEAKQPQTAETPDVSQPAPLAEQNNEHELKLVYGDAAVANKDAFVLLIMGDGFQADEQEKFFTESKNTADYVMATSPYDEFTDIIKIYALSVNSNESGARGDKSLTYEEAQKDTRDTYFGSSYYSGGMQRLLALGDDGADKANALKDTYLPTADFNVIMVNSSTYGGSGGSICVASLNNESLEMMLHELGHTIANLADEYFAGASYAREYANMTAESDPEKVKWNRFIGKNGVGVYEYDNGGNGWYRPHENCKMRFLGIQFDFCEICKEELRRAFSKDSNITSMSFQTYADELRESDTPIDMKQYFILRKGSNEANGNDISIANDLTLTYYDQNGKNETSVPPSKKGDYQVKADFAGNSTYDAISFTASYTLDYPDIISLKAETKIYDGKPVELKYTVSYDKEYETAVHYTGKIPYSTTPEQTNTYDSDTAPTVPGSYTAELTAYDKETKEIIGKASIDYSIKFKSTALADNNTNDYPGAQSYYNNQNIVFVGEGFTAAEQDKFEAIAKKYYDYFTTLEPYKEANLYFNYHTVQAISNESGISKAGTKKDTYFGLTIDQNGNIIPSELSTGAAMYLGNNQVTSYYKGAIVIVNDDSITGGARIDNKRVTLYAGANEAGMKYAATEFLNYYAGNPEGTDWMKDDTTKASARETLLKKLYYFWYGTSYAPILSRAYNDTFVENGTAFDLSSTFHTYVNGIEASGVSYKMTYYANQNGVIGKQLDSAPSKAGSYFAKAELVPDEGEETKTVTINGETHTLPIARGLTAYTIQAKGSIPEIPNVPSDPSTPDNANGTPVGTSVATGDEANILLFISLFVCALLAAGAAFISKKRRA